MIVITSMQKAVMPRAALLRGVPPGCRPFTTTPLPDRAAIAVRIVDAACASLIPYPARVVGVPVIVLQS